MGSFPPGHVLPGTLFLLVCAWHIWSSAVRYVSNPKTFRLRVWNPAPGFYGRLKYLEFSFIAIGRFVDRISPPPEGHGASGLNHGPSSAF
ncbi:unnamed protein product [Ilex paraguariensis]|uniref:Secreted protein n=1 Tax=Ilex paraguariensis TaxID=185542 RepID=A0ABC8UD65_9AQUA